MQRIAAKSVDINEDFRSVGDELPDPRIERGLIAVLWEGEPGEVERSCRRSLRPTLRWPPTGQVDGRPPLPLLLEKRERGRRTPVLGK
jgi:hypothetical protein